MDEVYMRQVIEKRIDRFGMIVMWGILLGSYMLLKSYTPWSPYWSLLLVIPLILVLRSLEQTLCDAIYKRRGYHDDPFRELVGVTDGRIAERIKWMGRLQWTSLIPALPLWVMVMVLVYGMDMKGDPLVTVLVGLGVFIVVTEHWWLEPLYRPFFKRRGLDNLYTERPHDG